MRKPAVGKFGAVKRIPSAASSLIQFKAPNDLEACRAAVESFQKEYPEDRYDIVRTPQEWHIEHMEFMKHAAGIYNHPREAEELEAIVYFDHAHARFVPSCTYCLETLPWTRKLFEHSLVCPLCQNSSTGEQAVRASYLLFLGERHPNCTLSHRDFRKRSKNVDPAEFVEAYQARIEEYRLKLDKAEFKALKLVETLFGLRAFRRLTKMGEMWVKGADGMHYRLFWSRHGNVAVYEHRTQAQAAKAGKEWKPITAYCGHFGEDYPITDQIIAQVLMLRTEPQKYIEQANQVTSEHMRSCGPEFMFKTKMSNILQTQG